MESRYLRDFKRHKPPSFDGGKVHPIGAENWLEAIDSLPFYELPAKVSSPLWDVYAERGGALLVEGCSEDHYTTRRVYYLVPV